MVNPGAAGRAAALVLALLGAAAPAACDDGQPRRGGQRAEQTTGGQPPPGPVPDRAEKAAPGSAAGVVGTWRVRLATGGGETAAVTYTFTADGRVTVGPEQTCRYRVADRVLSIDCAGTTAESARGRLARRGPNNLVWQVGDKAVRLERQAGLKERQ